MPELLLGLFLIGGFVGPLLLILANSDRPLPEWCFPVRGRWLRYLLGGFGVLLGLPFLLPLALILSPLFAIWGIAELAERHGKRRVLPPVHRQS